MEEGLRKASWRRYFPGFGEGETQNSCSVMAQASHVPTVPDSLSINTPFLPLPAPQFPAARAVLFKGGCGAERTQSAARRAGLDFKSPRPISGA